MHPRFFAENIENKKMEMPGFEPGTFHMQSERSTTELHPHIVNCGRALSADPERLLTNDP